MQPGCRRDCRSGCAAAGAPGFPADRVRSQGQRDCGSGYVAAKAAGSPAQAARAPKLEPVRQLPHADWHSLVDVDAARAADAASRVVGAAPGRRAERRFHRLDPAAGILGALLVVAALLEWRYRHLWLDDPYISFRYAWNLVHGFGLTYNPGQRVEGFSNPSWTVLAAAALALRLDPLVVSQVIGAALHLGTVIAVWIGVRRAQAALRSACLADSARAGAGNSAPRARARNSAPRPRAADSTLRASMGDSAPRAREGGAGPGWPCSCRRLLPPRRSRPRRGVPCGRSRGWRRRFSPLR